MLRNRIPAMIRRHKEVDMARNNLAHSILLSDNDILRIALFYRDWARLLEAKNIK